MARMGAKAVQWAAQVAAPLMILGLWAGMPALAKDEVKVAGFAFVDSTVTSQGSKAELPKGTKIYPSGTKVTGTTGCPTTPYRTDGLLVVVMDYSGRPTAGRVTITEERANGFAVARAPYQLDFNPGRVVQFLGPIFENGTYTLKIEYHVIQGTPVETEASLILDRSCAG